MTWRSGALAPWKRALAAAFAALAMPATAAETAAQPTLALTRMGAALSDGQTYGEQQAGKSCETVRTLRWRGDRQFDDPNFQAAFGQTMAGAGFKLAVERGGGSGDDRDLFGPQKPRRVATPDLQLGALITYLRVRLCTRRPDEQAMTEASVSMDVEWQVYSEREGKVVAKIQSHGRYDTEAPMRELDEQVLRRAFQRNVDFLAGDAAFLKLVRGAATPDAGPLQLLRIAFAPAHATPIGRAPQSVVSILVPNGHGSGVLVSADGYILTNRHVAGGAGEVQVVWPDGSQTPGQVVRADARRDVALIKTAPPKARALAIRHSPVTVGETVFAIGAPLDTQLAGTLTRGVVSARRTIDGQPLIQSDVAVAPGNSGGPLLDEKGAVVGLTVSGMATNGAPMGLNFFIPIDDALKVLALAPAA